jgi:hypothetical protein
MSWIAPSVAPSIELAITGASVAESSDRGAPMSGLVDADRPVGFVSESRLAGGLAGHASTNLRHKALQVSGKTFEALLR